MFGVLGEGDSDVDSLAVLVRRITGIRNISMKKHSFQGKGNLRKRSCRIIKMLSDEGAKRFIICRDADGEDPASVKASLRKVLRQHSCRKFDYEIIVPVQALEAWIIADETAIREAIPSLSIRAVSAPESQENPKGWLRNESRARGSRPLYAPAVHNPKVAEHIDLDKLEAKCPSFRPLREFVKRR